MTSDADIRGKVLSAIYQSRHNADGWVPLSDMSVAGIEANDRRAIGTICQHLATAGLIDWKPLHGPQAGAILGMGRITGLGVDVTEGRKAPSITVTLPIKSKNGPDTSAKRESDNGNFGSFRTAYDDLTDEVVQSREQFLPDHIENWFALLDETPGTKEIIRNLEGPLFLSFRSWFDDARGVQKPSRIDFSMLSAPRPQ